MDPSGISVMGRSGFTRSGCSSRISAIRRPLAALMVTITKIMESIISDIRMLMM